ncbi:hypothetical protein TH8_08690 [Thalassospira profundimaris]|uniref:hypothetical protein n=1 Tax=Thalassospira TaxID=168934 RepID=UPI000C514633|nr:hypothetical protein [Thalassospira sp.]MBC06171.1 hypothetical protein [Thalassospira sp.]RCK26770.1 hypothetical protein TH8_08690 [Thalassospira profundimaris]|tara:strand:- start:3799 stop:4218 length:420 start_codon:yes stop_codon:yes gene_type:complete
MPFISYVESPDGWHFLPPGEWIDGEFEWLCEVDGRHYAHVTSLDYGEQAEGIDLQHHGEAEIQHILDQSVPVQRVREERASEYQRALPTGEQLDAILKAFNHLRMNGTTLPAEMNEVIGRWLAVKRAHPKPTLLDDPNA